MFREQENDDDKHDEDQLQEDLELVNIALEDEQADEILPDTPGEIPATPNPNDKK